MIFDPEDFHGEPMKAAVRLLNQLQKDFDLYEDVSAELTAAAEALQIQLAVTLERSRTRGRG